MGRWNRRYYYRRRSKNYDNYQSPVRETLIDPETVDWQDNIPLLEKKFCYSSGISWEKVFSTTKFCDRNSNVFAWDDSAAKEAFNNAKQRFWAKNNGGHCDIELPDPDMYIDEIDWNPRIDPELMQEVDHEYFAPDRSGNGGKAGVVIFGKQEVDENPWEPSHNIEDVCWNNWGNFHDNGKGRLQSGHCHEHEGKQKVEENPQEQSNGLSTGDMGGNQWGGNRDSTRKLDDVEVSWELHCKQDDAAVQNDQWGISFTWKSQNHADPSNKFSPCGNRWKHDSEGTGNGQAEQWENSGSWHWKRMEAGNNMFPSAYSSRPQHQDYSRYRGGSNDRSSSWGKKRWGNYGREQNDSAKVARGQGEFNGISRRREGSNQTGRWFKGPRVPGGDYQATGQWKETRNEKRVSFAV